MRPKAKPRYDLPDSLRSKFEALTNAEIKARLEAEGMGITPGLETEATLRMWYWERRHDQTD